MLFRVCELAPGQGFSSRERKNTIDQGFICSSSFTAPTSCRAANAATPPTA